MLISSEPSSSHKSPLSLSDLLTDYLESLKKRGHSPHTLSSYGRDLSLFGEFMQQARLSLEGYNAIAQEQFVEFLNKKGRHSAASIRRALMAVRSFFQYIAVQGHLASPVLHIKAPQHLKKPLHVPSVSAFESLIEVLRQRALAGDKKAARDEALVLLAGVGGLKASELAALTWGDVICSSTTSQEGMGAGVRVIGEAPRFVPLTGVVSAALQRLGEARIELGLSTQLAEKLFFGYQSVSHVVATAGLERHGVKFIVRTVTREIWGEAYAVEALRAYAILRWLEEGLAWDIIAQRAGYSSLNSLERFVRASRQDLVVKKED